MHTYQISHKIKLKNLNKISERMLNELIDFSNNSLTSLVKVLQNNDFNFDINLKPIIKLLIPKNDRFKQTKYEILISNLSFLKKNYSINHIPPKECYKNQLFAIKSKNIRIENKILILPDSQILKLTEVLRFKNHFKILIKKETSGFYVVVYCIEEQEKISHNERFTCGIKFYENGDICFCRGKVFRIPEEITKLKEKENFYKGRLKLSKINSNNYLKTQEKLNKISNKLKALKNNYMFSIIKYISDNHSIAAIQNYSDPNIEALNGTFNFKKFIKNLKRKILKVNIVRNGENTRIRCPSCNLIKIVNANDEYKYCYNSDKNVFIGSEIAKAIRIYSFGK